MAVLVVTHPRFAEHDAGPGHPERPARLLAVLDGVDRVGLGDAVVRAAPRPATRAELERVHTVAHLDALRTFCARGGGRIDMDTAAVPASWEAAVLAAGAGVEAIERLDRGEADAAFVAARPPGHHARPGAAMGFCLINSIAVAAGALADRGERVLVVDWDVHHGNGTEEIFESDPRVAYLSLHQEGSFPLTGRTTDVGTGAGRGTTVNVPLPPGATGDVYLAAFDEVVAPLADRFGPTWVLVSAGFDAHRADPLAGMALSSGDFGALAERVMALAPAGRRLAFLEGGYHLDALAASAGACVAAMAGTRWHPEPPTSGGPGRDAVAAVAAAIGEDPTES